MRIRVLFFYVLVVITGCATSPPTSLESIVADKAPSWRPAYQKDFGKGKGTIREFAPDGENIKNWRHLATIQFIEGEKRSPKEFMSSLKANMKNRCENTRWDVLKEEKHSVTYEWSIESCPGQQDQQEIARIMRGNDGLHRIAYTEKGKEMNINNREKWLDAIDSAYVAKGSRNNPVKLESN